eukprot:s1543_g25.t1
MADEDGIEPGYSPSIAEVDETNDAEQVVEDDNVPFRALDLLETQPVFRLRRDIQMPEPNGHHEGVVWAGHFSEVAQSDQFQSELHDASSVVSVEVLEPDDLEGLEEVPQPAEEAVVPRQVWNEMVASSFAEYRQTNQLLLYPWETGALADTFNFQQDPLPRCPGIAEREVDDDANTSETMQVQLDRFRLPDGAKYVHAVKSLQDMSYFDSKSQKLELACGQWLNLLSIDWSASGVGPQLVTALQSDHTGTEATTILKACFGVKSPSTLLKRASTFRKYVTWFDKHGMGTESRSRPFPLDEVVVWQYFLWLKQQRESCSKGFAVPSSFLEAVRFAKFTLDLTGTDAILCSKRLLGFAALEKQAMGPSKQAPGMEVEHLWNGVVTDDWMQCFLGVYQAAGLSFDKVPLGPLLPAPRLDGTFCARPLTTAEAAEWLRGLLQGTGHAETFCSHSMKATLLGWCARAGLDRESRAVLGHHCSALNGSEVVYSRQLQIRALRKWIDPEKGQSWPKLGG